MVAVATVAACGGAEERCGPTTAIVDQVIDGDTIVLDDGTRVRYLMVDTPEITNGKNDCFGENARQYNSDLVLGKEVTLDYDVECTDRFDRLLAYVSVDGTEVNSLLVERGYACVLYIPPNGEDRETEFLTLEMRAKVASRGMWGTCQEIACD